MQSHFVDFSHDHQPVCSLHYNATEIGSSTSFLNISINLCLLTATILVYPYLQFKYCLCTSNKNQPALLLSMEIHFAMQHLHAK